MPVTWSKKTKTGFATCDRCGAKSRTYRIAHAAEALSIAEQAHEQEKWGYTVGFLAMLMGPETWCPGPHAPRSPDA